MKNTREIGTIGEDVACEWLENQGFLIVERNYLKKWGEIDIIAAKDKIVHFIEVKSVIRKDKSLNTGHRPEENVHELKTRRLKRTIQTYLLERRLGSDALFKFHIIVVHLMISSRRGRVEMLENVIL